jgi:hypothetical protein
MSHTKIQTTGIVVDLLLVDGVILPKGARPPELRTEDIYKIVFLRFFKNNGIHLDIEFDMVGSTRELTSEANIEIEPPSDHSGYFHIGIYDKEYYSERVARPDYVKDFLEVETV